MTHNCLYGKVEEYIKEMPALPAVAAKALKICNNTRINPSDLNYLISLDPVFTGRLLHLVNSTFFKFGPHVTSLVRAVTMLGLNTVKNLALSAAVLPALPKNENIGMDMEGFWRHCLCVGTASKLLAVRQGVDSMLYEEYFTAGLLHDVGKIPLNAIFRADYVLAVITSDREYKSLPAAEENILGMSHCTAGAMTAGAWKLEMPVVDVIIHHHDACGYTGENKKILYTVAIANYCSSFYDMGFAGNKNPEKPEPEIWEDSGISENVIEELKEPVLKEIKKAQKFLNI
jgi:putative nucleotidyltransferase with HDIG domain